MAVALRAHPPLPDRRRPHPPGRCGIRVGAEDDDLVRREPAVPQRRVRGEPREPAADDGDAAPFHFDGAGEQALDEVALEGEEDGQRDDERDERGRRDDVDVRAELAKLARRSRR